MRYLAIALDEASRVALQAWVTHPEIRAEHVTLAYEPPEHFQSEWLPLGYQVGDAIAFTGVGLVDDGTIQSLIVEIAGTSRRVWDGGVLHVTLSKEPDVPSVRSNELLQSDHPVQSVAITLFGVITWLESVASG